jgi:sentrin-specific protease 1
MLVPIHMEIPEHWILAMIDFREHQIKLYDSMRAADDRKQIRLKLLELLGIMMQNTHVKLDKKLWKTKGIKKIPQQGNGRDCGVFMCTFAEYLSRNGPIDFMQEDMDYLRVWIAHAILRGNITVPNAINTP